nr:copper-binding protein [uncultured Albidiferax sp.]
MQLTHSLLKALAIAAISTAALAQTALPYADAEVRKVDLSAQKITLKHGEIKNLDMPPMSMVFQVKNPALLEKIKAGDKVKFTVEQIGSALVVTDIQPAP